MKTRLALLWIVVIGGFVALIIKYPSFAIPTIIGIIFYYLIKYIMETD